MENFHTAEGIAILEKYKNKLLEVAKAKAVKDLLEEKYKKQIDLDLQKEKVNNELKLREKSGFWSKSRMKDSVLEMAEDIGLSDGGAITKANKYKIDVRVNDSDIKILEKLFKNNESKNIDPNDPILGGSGSGPKGDDKPKKEKPYNGSKLTGNQKDYLKDLEADKNEKLALIKTEFLEGKFLEDEFIKKSLAVNIAYHNSKIAYLKKGNAEERKQEAQAKLDKINDISEANDKLYNLYKKRYDDELKLSELTAKDKFENVEKNPYSTDSEKLEAEKIYHQESIDAQMVFTQKMLDFNIQYSKNTNEETDKLLRELKLKNDEANRNTLESKIKARELLLKEVDKTYEQIANANEIGASGQKMSIINDKTLTQ